MKGALEWLKAHKGPTGTVLSMAWLYMHLHPELGLLREVLGIVSGALIGAGYADKDSVEKARQEFASNGGELKRSND